jgi:ribosomal protein L35
MKKSITTRFRVTKNGKVIRRTMAQCHFRAKKSSTQIHRIQRMNQTSHAISEKILKKPGSF